MFFVSLDALGGGVLPSFLYLIGPEDKAYKGPIFQEMKYQHFVLTLAPYHIKEYAHQAIYDFESGGNCNLLYDTTFSVDVPVSSNNEKCGLRATLLSHSSQ